MKRTICFILLSAMLVTAMLSVVYADVQIVCPEKLVIYEPCSVTVIPEENNIKDYEPSDFPELPVVKVDIIYSNIIQLTYDKAAHITVEEALMRISRNPIVKKVQPTGTGWFDTIPISGDVNEDGRLNSEDIILMMKYMLGSAELPPVVEYCVADVNGDGWINSKDIIQVMKWILED